MAGYDNNKLGELRPNQIITTFGPGAIVDAVKDSVTVLDINYWKEKGKKTMKNWDFVTRINMSGKNMNNISFLTRNPQKEPVTYGTIKTNTHWDW